MLDGYSICFNEWALDKEIGSDLGLLMIISSLTAERGYCFASNEYLAKLFNVNEVSISRKINKLAKKGYIKINYERRGAEVIKRELRLTKMLIDDKQKSQPTINKNVKDNNTSINITSINKESKGAKTFDEIICEYTENLETQNLLKEWLKVRKSKRGAMTNYAIELNLKKMDSLALESGMILNNYLEEVIRRGWVAFYKINNYDNKEKTQNNKISSDLQKAFERLGSNE